MLKIHSERVRESIGHLSSKPEALYVEQKHFVSFSFKQRSGKRQRLRKFGQSGFG